MARTYRKRALTLFTYIENRERLEAEGLFYMQGQCEVVLDILRSSPGPWTSKLLGWAIKIHPEYRGKTPPTRVANYFIYRLKKAGVLTFYKNLEEWEKKCGK